MEPDERIDAGALIEALVEADVIEPGEELVLTESFRESLATHDEDFHSSSPEDRRAAVMAVTETDVEAEALLEIGEDVPMVLPEYLALAERTELDHADRLRALSIFDSFRDPPPDHGAPKAFLPVSGNRLPLLVSLYEKALVYVWREDCPPCDLVKEDLDELLSTPPTELALFAVYGPDSAENLHDWYDIQAGPATLFFLRGEVDARLYGAYHTEVLETEIEKHLAMP